MFDFSAVRPIKNKMMNYDTLPDLPDLSWWVLLEHF